MAKRHSSTDSRGFKRKIRKIRELAGTDLIDELTVFFELKNPNDDKRDKRNSTISERVNNNGNALQRIKHTLTQHHSTNEGHNMLTKSEKPMSDEELLILNKIVLLDELMRDGYEATIEYAGKWAKEFLSNFRDVDNKIREEEIAKLEKQLYGLR